MISIILSVKLTLELLILVVPQIKLGLEIFNLLLELKVAFNDCLSEANNIIVKFLELLSKLFADLLLNIIVHLTDFVGDTLVIFHWESNY